MEFVSEITDVDIKKNYTAVIDLTATYNISVYATKPGYEDSEIATATLCWIDVEPRTEGITGGEDAVAEIKAMPVLIQRDGLALTIGGAPAGTPISVYDLSGRLITTATAGDLETRVKVDNNSDVIIVKVGEKTVKVAK